MSKKKSIRVNGSQLLVGILALCVSSPALAEYVPFPGKIVVRLLDVIAPNAIFVNFETWPGFHRSIRITLPGIVVPEDTPQADDCERKKAQKAMTFTRNFLSGANKIYVHDMRMETSADVVAVSPILTNKGSLGVALEKERLARSATVDPKMSWCR